MGVYEIKEFSENGRSPFADWFDGLDGKTLVILLGGGSKRRQSADIEAAIARWKRYKAGR